MPYTHTFEFVVDGINTEGEVSYNGGGEPRFKTNNPEELTINQHGGIQHLHETFVNIFKKYGEIEKIVVEKKAV